MDYKRCPLRSILSVLQASSSCIFTPEVLCEIACTSSALHTDAIGI